MSWRSASSTATALALTILAGGPVRAQAPAPGATIQDGSVVRIEYTLRDQTNGEVIQTNRGGQALSYTQGRGQIIPGLERQLAGMRVGEEKKVVVPPDDGYGPADASSRLEVPKAQIPPEARLGLGAQLMARSTEGQERPVVVTEVRATTVVLDLNHPLAGKTLLFDVRILGIDPPAAPPPAAPPPAAPPPQLLPPQLLPPQLLPPQLLPPQLLPPQLLPPQFPPAVATRRSGPDRPSPTTRPN